MFECTELRVFMRRGGWEEICKNTLGLLISVVRKNVVLKKGGEKGGGKKVRKKVGK